MLTNVMDFYPRITTDGSGYGAEYGEHCNFHFGYGRDIIDENAQNEKCCVQAIGFLIAKADSEIQDLEDELAILQCQLKWGEPDMQRDPYDVCCAAFKRKIGCLTSSIQTMRNGNVSIEHDMKVEFDIQRPAERIYDIINTLIRDNFLVPDEEVGDLSNGEYLPTNPASLNIDTDLGQQHATSLELFLENEEQETVCERHKLVHTFSEESSSDAARYTTKDSNEAIDFGNSNVEVAGKSEFDTYSSASEGKSRLSRSLKSIMTQTHLQDSTSEGNSRADVLQQRRSQKCMTGPKKGENTSLPLSSKTKVIVKAEKEDHDIITQHFAIDSFSKMQDPKKEDPVENHLKVIENQSLNVVITYGRKKSGLSSVRKPQEQRKFLSNLGVRKLEPESFEQASSPSYNIEGRHTFIPETNRKRKPGIKEDILRVNPSRDLETKRRQLLGVKALVLATDSELPANDLESVRLEISRDPGFLNKLRVSDLKEIMKQNNLPGYQKLKKQTLIERITTQLNL